MQPQLRNLPAQGWDRQRKKKQTVAEKLAQAAQNRNRWSRYAQGGAPLGSPTRAFQGNRGGARAAALGRIARPPMFPGRGVGVSGRFGQDFPGGGPAIRVGPPPAPPSPAEVQGTLGGPAPPPRAQPGGLSGGVPQSSPGWLNPQDPQLVVTSSEQARDFFSGLLGPDPTQQPGGSTAGGNLGNLVPLGGGLYIDPSSGAIYGAGGGNPGAQLF